MKEFHTPLKLYNSVLKNIDELKGLRNNKSFDVDFSIELSREDKHLKVLIYNFMKYKFERINKGLENPVVNDALNYLKHDFIHKR
jgi:hypothetical protein